jgi:PAS domain S-box-containing protein
LISDDMHESLPQHVTDAIRHTAQLFDTEQQAVIGTVLSGEIVYWNRAAERLYGWHASEVIGRNIVEVTPSDMSREQAEAIMRNLRLGRSWKGSFLVRARDGREFRAQVRDLPVQAADGELVGIVGTSTALTL